MAGKATKKQAQSNNDILNNLYKISIPIVFLAYLRMFLSNYNNTWITLTLLHLPMFACIYILDKSGRPIYEIEESTNGQKSKKKLIRQGMDLSQEGGLTEYMFDIIYLSLFSDFGKILFNTNKVWYISLTVIPIYVGYKLYGLKNQFFGNKNLNQGASSTETTNDADSNNAKSKRQLKREKRGDKVQVKYR
ncbi:hypothetical protein Kpol_1023p20 [Vanderwaltozyma polyspora DSM 70294]|uniref:Uncharacterized protein n=1 Tax=Vanderwaltozyma polyspora (strain ATCC 22028 / DSM 70294 / BCRC 21397 / CBS 2163 / NBRC 10782 / NRRL Y-8283 / UCD 57-17) TaxID=436907 RepID=A7TFP3_VANPO|nr:uncharacterized protein Kpol_1023p20 [Vanderwaltozyma polyspora DSM 70294]EDO18851.1 hypothetical protein Kpol_1023p20 [Vanderwaltozyma polyspora DSM 70294]